MFIFIEMFLKDGGRMVGEWIMCYDNGYIDDM